MQPQNRIITATLTVDLKRHRLRIPGRTFELINDPDYFRFLVNPEDKGIILECCSEHTKGAYQLSKAPYHKGSYELTSVSLVTEIVRCAGFTGTSAIRLVGYHIRGQAAIFFRMEQCPEFSTVS